MYLLYHFLIEAIYHNNILNEMTLIYLYELATLFHSYWNMGKENSQLRFISEDKSFIPSRLILLQALGIVIKNGMNILGVSTPSRM